LESDTDYVIEGLKSYRERLTGDVLHAFESRGAEFGSERFAVWRRRLYDFLDNNLPGESSRLDAKLSNRLLVIRTSESDASIFWRDQGDKAVSFLDSLILDLEQQEYELVPQSNNPTAVGEVKKQIPSDKLTQVFIVHGHDDLTKIQTARFVETLGFKAVILHEQASRGKTIIEKIEACTDVGFAIVLYTADDQGSDKASASEGKLRPRARQNVLFEHGYLMSKLGRERVVPLVSGDIEIPSDIHGMVYVTDTDWQISIAKEMLAAGYDVDFNKLLKLR
jgi:predicted nucleotide-binding protein